ncbi:hypothetical protein [Blastococcus deserti]|uniref:DUF4386 family protein n=1 Tax=Blastococcus deserti TaxID=2259033 RepID=A0ABW4X3Q9_9ACTN
MDTFIRWSGRGLVMAGVLTLSVLWHPDIFETGFAAASREPLWGPGHAAGLLVVVLTLLGLAGWAARLGRRMGRLGAVGVVLAVVGLVLTAGLAALEAFAFPVLAREAPELLELDGPLLGSATIRVLGGLALLWLIGLACVGLATERSGALPRGAGWLLALGAVSFAAFEGPFVPVLGPLSVVVFAAGQAWFGLALSFALPSEHPTAGAPQHQPA